MFMLITAMVDGSLFWARRSEEGILDLLPHELGDLFLGFAVSARPGEDIILHKGEKAYVIVCQSERMPHEGTISISDFVYGRDSASASTGG